MSTHVRSSISICFQSGKTALHLAARGSYVTIVDMIIKAERYFSTNRASGIFTSHWITKRTTCIMRQARKFSQGQSFF